jgi:phosphonoacetate hydrolase
MAREPDYIEQAIAAGLAPNLDRLMKTGANTGGRLRR